MTKIETFFKKYLYKENLLCYNNCGSFGKISFR